MPQISGTPPKPTIAEPRLPHPVSWSLPWLSAVAVFVVREWSRPGDRPTLMNWFLQAEPDALIYLALLIAAPLLWWFRRDEPRTHGSVRRMLFSGLDWCLDPQSDSSEKKSHWRPACLSTLVGFVSLAASVHVGAQFDDLPPAYHDEYSYLFQAETFLAGRVSFPSHSAARLFDQMHVLNEGRFASRYFPGTGLWMAPFVALGHPYWGHWAAGAICAVLMFWIGRELAGDGAGLLSGLLTALSPGMALFSNLLLAHHPTLVGLGVFILGFLRMIRSGASGWTLVSGAGLAFAMLCRPMTAAGVALPFGVYAVYWAIQQKRLVVVGLGIPLLVALGGLFFYDQAITGSGWQTPYGLYTDLHTPRHVFGFNNVERGNRRQGPRVIKNYDEWAENLTPRLAVANAGTRLVASSKWTLGLIPLTLSFVGGLVVWRRLNRGTGLILASIVSLHVVHIPYWFVGMEDHHYVFEAAKLWCLWVAVVSITTLRIWQVERRLALCAWWGGLLAAAVAMNVTISSGVWSAPLEQGIGRVAFARAEHGRFLKLAASRALPRPALVLVDSDPADRHIDYVVNSPDLSGPLLIGHYIPETVSLDDVRKLFPDRSLFVYRIRNVFHEGQRLREEEWRKIE